MEKGQYSTVPNNDVHILVHRSCYNTNTKIGVSNYLEISDGIRGITLCHYPMMSWKHKQKTYIMSLYKGIFWIKNIDNYDPIAIKEFGLTKENGIESILLKTDMSDHYLCYLDKEV